MKQDDISWHVPRDYGPSRVLQNRFMVQFPVGISDRLLAILMHTLHIWRDPPQSVWGSTCFPEAVAGRPSDLPKPCRAGVWSQVFDSKALVLNHFMVTDDKYTKRGSKGGWLESVLSFNQRPPGTHLQINKLGSWLIAVRESIPWGAVRYLRLRELERTYDSIWAWVRSFGEGLRKKGVLSLGYSQKAGTVLWLCISVHFIHREGLAGNQSWNR